MKWEHINKEMITIYSTKTAHREATQRNCPAFPEFRDYLKMWEPIHRQHFPESSYIFPDYHNVNRNTVENQLDRILKNHVVTEIINGGKNAVLKRFGRNHSTLFVLQGVFAKRGRA